MINIKNIVSRFYPASKNSIVLLMVVLVSLVAVSFKQNTTITKATVTDSLVSKAAFLKVYEVLVSPRCLNCHPKGDVPLQGDESKPHAQGAKRGKDGRGMYASKCINCHQDANQAGPNMPPGSPDWRMPPADIKMVFQGRTARELAAQLLDTATNGHLTKEGLIKHMEEEALVLAGWNPGEGRSTPPLTHAELIKQTKLWIEKGAYLPN